ncbi:hypothetical protein TRFO_23346 [Tritrichomonas foetus]|uniref:Glycoside hydrolase family 5 domain-containing protein n=1 Tax=Tritrichomonas foetus TaxID=1144522 RepID=A0A1J4KBC6_9EUKA|nr:hypothetical protein TRFO_23346 [Tritrichomonas foetus]|eukprot:OHT08200.1 hypothetical protein TRFO_23346 [Tritrichomonas foetus]
MTTRNISQNTLVNLSYLNTPITDHLQMYEGHFFTKDRERVRLFGTNVCYSNAFPLKTQAKALAQRMSQIGINVVRFHHMDNHNIWDQNDNTQFDEENIDRLHFFIKCLGEEGIYVNLNLHVSRVYPLPEFTETLQNIFSNGKPLDRFYDPFIEMQKEYARKLLGATNNYTGYIVGQDPIVAFIEINNENSLHYIDEKLDSIKETVFETALLEKWHAYLTEKYGNYNNLKTSWNPNDLNETNIYENVEFETYFPSDCGAKSNGEADGEYIATINTDSNSNSQLVYYGQFEILPSTYYTIEMKMKASSDRTVTAFFQHYDGLYDVLSDDYDIELTNEWKEIKIVMQTYSESEFLQGKIKFVISLYKEIGSIYYTEPIVKLGREIDFSSNETIEGIDLPNGDSVNQMWEHFRLFIDYTENYTQKAINEVLYNELNISAFVTDSQANYGSFLSLKRQSEMSNFIDIHNYWDQPQFPDGEDMNYDLYWIHNKPMVSDPELGTFSFMTVFHVDGLPFTVSEYNTAFPNEYMAELLPLVSTWGAFHDWDAIYQFDYNQAGNWDHEPNYITGFYSMSENPLSMIMAPFAALAFRNYGIKTADKQNIAKIPVEMLLERNKERRPNYWSFTQWVESTNVFFPGITKVSFVPNGTSIEFNEDTKNCNMPFLTEEIEWRIDNEKGKFMAKGATVNFGTGFIDQFCFDDFTINVTREENDTVTVGIASLDERPLNESTRILLSIVGKVANSNQQWIENRTSTRGSWGEAPVLAQFIPFDLEMKSETVPNITILNPDGDENGTFPLIIDNNKWTFSHDFNHPSMWFLVSRDDKIQFNTESNTESVFPEVAKTSNYVSEDFTTNNDHTVASTYEQYELITTVNDKSLKTNSEKFEENTFINENTVTNEKTTDENDFETENTILTSSFDQKITFTENEIEIVSVDEDQQSKSIFNTYTDQITDNSELEITSIDEDFTNFDRDNDISSSRLEESINITDLVSKEDYSSYTSDIPTNSFEIDLTEYQGSNLNSFTQTEDVVNSVKSEYSIINNDITETRSDLSIYSEASIISVEEMTYKTIDNIYYSDTKKITVSYPEEFDSKSYFDNNLENTLSNDENNEASDNEKESSQGYSETAEPFVEVSRSIPNNSENKEDFTNIDSENTQAIKKSISETISDNIPTKILYSDISSDNDEDDKKDNSEDNTKSDKTKLILAIVIPVAVVIIIIVIVIAVCCKRRKSKKTYELSNIPSDDIMI